MSSAGGFAAARNLCPIRHRLFIDGDTVFKDFEDPAEARIPPYVNPAQRALRLFVQPPRHKISSLKGGTAHSFTLEVCVCGVQENGSVSHWLVL